MTSVSDDQPAPLQYWDSPLFISFLTKQSPERVDVVRQLIRDAQSRPPKVRVIASHFVRAEVIPHPNDDPDQTATLERFFRAAGSVVRFRDVDRYVASLARDLVAQHSGDGLTVPDAIHLATAIASGVEMFFTYDGARDNVRRRSGGLLKFNGVIGTPHLQIMVPTVDYGPIFKALDPGTEQS
jgi:predicted nucleic acid-binding protein